MMEKNRKHREQLLLDFHLDQLDDEDRAWIEAELLRDGELRAKSDRLGEVLRPLDHWTVAASPANLADKILTSVERQSSTMSVMAATPAEAGYRPRSSFTLSQFIAVAASIALLAMVGVPALSALRAKSQRAQCAGNLGSVFRGVSLYQQAFDGSLPFAGQVAGAAWLPGLSRDRPFASNSRHVYLVARLSYAKPGDFICPSCKTATPMPADELANYHDFAACRNVSFASLNLSGANPTLRPRSQMPYMSDANPLFANARFDAGIDPSRANSSAHGRRAGQSVMFLDGSVRWMTSPMVGSKKDNVWLAGRIREYNGTETPTDADDAFLIPGFPKTDKQFHQRQWQ